MNIKIRLVLAAFALLVSTIFTACQGTTRVGAYDVCFDTRPIAGILATGTIGPGVGCGGGQMVPQPMMIAGGQPCIQQNPCRFLLRDGHNTGWCGVHRRYGCAGSNNQHGQYGHQGQYANNGISYNGYGGRYGQRDPNFNPSLENQQMVNNGTFLRNDASGNPINQGTSWSGHTFLVSPGGVAPDVSQLDPNRPMAYVYRQSPDRRY